MGFKTGAYAKVWEVSPLGANSTKIRVSISKKNKMSGEYEDDFSGYIVCYGDAAIAASKLVKGARIKLGDCDVSTKYDKAKGVTYTNFKLYTFDGDTAGGSTATKKADTKAVDDGEVEVDVECRDTPF